MHTAPRGALELETMERVFTRGRRRNGRHENTFRCRLFVAMTTALCVITRVGVVASAVAGTPALNTLVTRRVKVFVPALDRALASLASSWFAELGYVVLNDVESIGTGAWGGRTRFTDASLATSACVDDDVNATAVNAYDVVTGVVASNALEDLFTLFPESKVVVFESLVSEWWPRAETEASAAEARATTCGCASTRSLSSSCGDESYHFCDIYPCLYERAFGSAHASEIAWKGAYVDRAREIKRAIPRASTLVVPMSLKSPSHARAVAIARAIGEFLAITDDVDAFAERYPFEALDLRRAPLGAGATAWIVVATTFALYVVFVADRTSVVRRMIKKVF